MKKILKWLGVSLGAILLALAGTAFYLNSAAKSRLAKRYDVQPKPIVIPTDSASLAAGKIWVSVMCMDCHGDNLAGNNLINEPDMAVIYGPNITSGGVTKGYADVDWDRAIRHGVGKDGHPLFIMPAKGFQYMSGEHVGQIIAYMKTVAPVEQVQPPIKTTLLGNILFQTGAFGDILNAETVDHAKPSHFAPPEGPTAQFGEYLVKIGGCRTCHGEQLNGSKHPDPNVPIPGPNLTPGGALASWGADGFIKTMHSGVTPLGKEINNEYMPWKVIGRLNDRQLQAIYAYLMSLPKLDMAEIK